MVIYLISSTSALTSKVVIGNSNNNGFEVRFGVKRRHRGPHPDDVADKYKLLDLSIYLSCYHAGVMKHVGDALGDTLVQSKSNIVTLGIAPWGAVHNNDDLLGPGVRCSSCAYFSSLVKCSAAEPSTGILHVLLDLRSFFGIGDLWGFCKNFLK